MCRFPIKCCVFCRLSSEKQNNFPRASAGQRRRAVEGAGVASLWRHVSVGAVFLPRQNRKESTVPLPSSDLTHEVTMVHRLQFRSSVLGSRKPVPLSLAKAPAGVNPVSLRTFVAPPRSFDARQVLFFFCVCVCVLVFSSAPATSIIFLFAALCFLHVTQEWPSCVHPMPDQGHCAAHWAVAPVSVRRWLVFLSVLLSFFLSVSPFLPPSLFLLTSNLPARSADRFSRIDFALPPRARPMWCVLLFGCTISKK